jgi:hypothetical protein
MPWPNSAKRPRPCPGPGHAAALQPGARSRASDRVVPGPGRPQRPPRAQRRFCRRPSQSAAVHVDIRNLCAPRERGRRDRLAIRRSVTDHSRATVRPSPQSSAHRAPPHRERRRRNGSHFPGPSPLAHLAIRDLGPPVGTQQHADVRVMQRTVRCPGSASGGTGTPSSASSSLARPDRSSGRVMPLTLRAESDTRPGGAA